MILVKVTLSCMVGFLLALFYGIVLIPILKKIKASQRLSIYLEEAHHKKIGTPTMGGIIFISSTLTSIILLIILKKINISYSLIIVLFTFISYGLIGFMDDYLIIKRNNNVGLKPSEKMLLQLIVALIYFYLFMISNNEPLLWIHTLGIKINIGWFYGLFILFVLTASSNAVNLTDGLDGLAGGLSAIAFFTFGILSYYTGWLEGYVEVSLFCFILFGAILGFLVFNVNPAKVFMGDTGSLCLGATLGGVAILTRHEVLLIVIGIVFVIETLSCIIQTTYYKLTHKRLFPMAPIHHSFEKCGWRELDIVRLFWIVGLVASMISIMFGVII
ncbi:MAG: phospho-N-acetylmuramoyl-pentapeptide-transferase [Bacilli bacterium]|nr:phospho-N-acetylmuramoyl-pentapeptide-transferase [Bacilli bacterium]